MPLLPIRPRWRTLIPCSWSSLYSSDLDNRQSVPTHTGTTWFDNADAERKIVRYLASLTGGSSSERLSPATTSFLDLGTGNGSQLLALRRAGWAGPLVGVDYSSESIELAKRIRDETIRGKEKGVEVSLTEDNRYGNDLDYSPYESGTEDDESGDGRPLPLKKPIEFYTHDILSPVCPARNPPWLPPEGFDVVLDKGTFDAISLNDEVDSQGRRVCEGYPRAVKPLVKRRGVLLITSCNWTEKELEEWIVGSSEGAKENDFTVLGMVPYPKFKFGGVEGQSVVGIAFRRS